MTRFTFLLTFVLGLSLLFMPLQNAIAFSYTFNEYLPPQLSVQFKSDPNGPVRRGDTLRFDVLVKNSSNQPFNEFKLRISTNFQPDLELRKVSPQPHLLNDSKYRRETNNYDVMWENQVIPAHGSKRFYVVYRINPGQDESHNISIQMWPNTGDRVAAKTITVPISSSLGNQSTFNGSIPSNIFFAAVGRFPTKSENEKWTKYYKTLSEDPGVCIGTESCNKGSYMLKKIAEEFKIKHFDAQGLIDNKDVPMVVGSSFQKVFGRRITSNESVYWKQRARSDKNTVTGLESAMTWHKLHAKH